MSHPFPGMNPWLESRQLWRGVHTSLITSIRDWLAPQVEPRYFVDIETHAYVTQAPDQPTATRYPDVAVVDLGGAPVATATSAATATPTIVTLPEQEFYEEPYLEVRLLPEDKLVTVIELLSHTNKRSGPERDSYIRKRNLYLDTDVNFVEIDLLRAWNAMPYTELNQQRHHYRIFIHRRDEPRQAFLYRFNVREPIPRFPLPLLDDDDEPVMDLGELLQALYDRARYRLIIDYAEPPSPALSKKDAAWAEACVATGGSAQETGKDRQETP